MRSFASFFAAAFLILAPLSPASAQSVDIAKLMAPGALPDKSQGNVDAPVTVIEYASLTCPHCGRFYRDVFPAFKEKYVDTGKVRFILREYPLDQLALAGAMIARCGPEDRYFDIIHTLFNEQGVWVDADEPGAAVEKLLQPYGLTAESIRACLGDEKLVEGIIEIARNGRDFGVTGTPAFFINGTIHAGGMSIEALSATIDPLVAAAPTSE